MRYKVMRATTRFYLATRRANKGTRFGPNGVAADIRKWKIQFFGDLGGILEELVYCKRMVENFLQSETNEKTRLLFSKHYRSRSDLRFEIYGSNHTSIAKAGRVLLDLRTLRRHLYKSQSQNIPIQ